MPGNNEKFIKILSKLSVRNDEGNSNYLLGRYLQVDKVLKSINKRYNINLSIPIISRIGLQRKIKSEIIKLDLQPIPLKWLGYSL